MEYNVDAYGNPVDYCGWCRVTVYPDDEGRVEWNNDVFCCQECASNAEESIAHTNESMAEEWGDDDDLAF